VRYRDCWCRPWTGISGRNAGDQAAGRMVQGQRNWSLKRRRLVMCLRSLQSPLTLQKVTLSDWIVCTVRVKKNPPEVIWIFFMFSFFQKRLRIFNRFFTHRLYVPIYARLQIFIQLSPTLTTKLCHIKRDYLVHIMCTKCPPSAKTRAFRRLRKSLIALLIVVCGKSLHFCMSTNMSDMTWRQQWRHLLRKQTSKLNF